MMTLFLGLMACIGLALMAHWVGTRLRLHRLASYGFPDYLVQTVQKTYPHLSPHECAKVMDGLRQYFVVAILAGPRRIAMPSQAVDEAWHAFILSTRAYAGFCERVLGRFLHHTPAEAMTSPSHAQESIRRTWRFACQREGIDPRRPERLPLLFAIDGALAIPGGFVYRRDCGLGRAAGIGGGEFCAGHIGCSSAGSFGCSGDGGCGGDGGGGGCGGD